MHNSLLIRNLSTTTNHELKVLVAGSFLSRLQGLIGKTPNSCYEGFLIKRSLETRLTSGVHTYFLSKPLFIVWINSQMIVSEKTILNPWKFYLPENPAMYLFETNPSEYNYWNIGDKLKFYEI